MNTIQNYGMTNYQTNFKGLKDIFRKKQVSEVAQSAINTKAEDEVLDYIGFQAPLNAIKKFERMKNAQKLEAIEALDKLSFQMPRKAADKHIGRV